MNFFDHLERVLRTAVLLSEKEGADLELVQFARERRLLLIDLELRRL